MMKKISTTGPRRANRTRGGMTLTEVIFAVAILLVGVLSIMSLVPVSIHQIASTTDNTVGAAVARNALVSLRYGFLDAMDHEEDNEDVGDMLFSTAYRNGDICIYNLGAESNLADFAGWPAVIYALHDARADYALRDERTSHGFGFCGEDTELTGFGPTFQIPGDTVLFDPHTIGVLFPSGSERREILEALPVGGGSTINHPRLIPSGWARDYYWSATFLPISSDDDADGDADEDPLGDVDDDGDADDDSDGVLDEDDIIMPGTSYRVQLAVWRVINPRTPIMLFGGDSGVDLTADWQEGTDIVTIRNLPEGGLRMVNNFDYIRMDDYGVWYRIASIENQHSDEATDPPTITLVSEFTHPDSGAVFRNMNVTIASDFKLVGLYEDIITAPEIGGTP